MARERVHDHLDEFVERVEAWRIASGVEYDLVHAHYWLSGVVGLALRERWRVPMLQMFHTLGRLKNRVARTPAEREPDVRIAEETRVIALADRLVAANDVECEHLVHLYAAVHEHIAVVPCGVDTELFRPGSREHARAALGLDARPVLLYVGRITPIKGLDTLLGAVAHLVRGGRTVNLLVVGGDTDDAVGGHEADLRRRIEALGLAGAVRFVGARPQADLRDYYVAADATVLPSTYESFGMVALEAMACGSPVIASRVGGLTTTVRDGVTGLLVPEGDARTLADRIAEVLDDPGLAWRLGREGVRWASQHAWPCVAEAICRQYATLEPRAGRYLGTTRCQA
jgi:D-inositol-3-phosphate glycosyltransferase